jgi:O-antigen ligase
VLSRLTSGPRGRNLLILGGAVLGGAVAAATTLGPYVVAAVVLLAFLFVIPARWLPVLGLLLFLTPFDDGPDIHSAVRAVVISLPIVVYYLRRRSQLSWSFGVAWTASWLVVVGVLSSLFGIRPVPSLVFLTPVVVLVVVPLALREMPAEDYRLLVRVWAWSVAVLSVYGLVEFIAAKNVLDPWYALAVSPLVQKWDTYRITTTIGHPLLNGMFFAASFALFCWQLLDERSVIGRKAAVLGMAASLGATVLSGSRSALIAAAFGGAVLSLASTSRQPARVKWTIRLGLPVGLVAAFAYVWTSRLGGDEADTSVEVRRDIYGTAAQLIDQRFLLGSGPGYAWEQNEMYGPYSKVPLESSALEFVVGWGVLGTAMALVVAAVYVVTVVRRGRALALAPLAAVVTSSLFFNFIEGDSKGMLLVCSAILLAVTPAREARDEQEVVRRPGAWAGVPRRARSFAGSPAR